ncbi:DegT/DnrJ/EryC1/StrS family aminotransferase [Candidatus Pelagibacter sp.]|nr:DegT/DnrJ/EryC1/StrS family aminotransferase [Candidatus Pelagibacter sp.]
MKNKIRLFNLDLQKKEETKIKHEINRIISHQNFINGEQIKNFKNKIKKLFKTNYCITTNSGTDALYVALRALNIKSGDEVLTSSHSWISTSEVIKMVGAKPVFIDTGQDFNIDLDKLEKKITQKTKAIIVVHLYGRMVDCKKLLKIKKKYKIKIIEDCAQSFLSKYKNKFAGTIGDIGAFSFFPTKNLGAFGDAGCVICKDKMSATKIEMLVSHGSLNKKDFKLTGINSRMDTIQAAVLLVKIAGTKKKINQKYKNFKLYKNLLKNNKYVELNSDRKNYLDNYYLLTIKCKNRNKLKNWLQINGIETGIYYEKLLPFNSVYNNLNLKHKDFEVSLKNNKYMLSLPIHQGLRNRDIKYICSLINKFYKII